MYLYRWKHSFIQIRCHWNQQSWTHSDGSSYWTNYQDWHVFKGHRREWAGNILQHVFGGGKIRMHWDGNSLEEHGGFAPVSFAKRNFLPVRRKGVCAHPGLEHPGVGRQLGCEKHIPGELGSEPEALATQVFSSPGDCKVFIFLLSLSHSLISSETYWCAGGTCLGFLCCDAEWPQPTQQGGSCSMLWNVGGKRKLYWSNKWKQKCFL